MDNQIRHDLKINGSGSSTGGFFDKVKINGDGRIGGDIDCYKFTTNGSSQTHGNVKADQISVNGTANFNGNIQSDKMSIRGQSYINGRVSTKEINISGALNINENIVSEFMKIYGSIDVKGDCEVENLTARGGFTIGGLLNVGTMDLKINWHCMAKEIGGERIIVRRNTGLDMAFKSLLRMFKFIPDPMLIADSIEGDDISLEFTKASVVRGNNIEIGPGCEIDHVEYRGRYHQAPDAKVNSCVQV